MNNTSVVVPMYNEANHAREVVLSILADTVDGENTEVVVCDDASTDATPAILADMAQRHGNLRVLRNDTNRGIAHTLNRLTDAAHGDYLIRVDGDTRVRPGGLKTVADELQDGADLVCGHIAVWQPTNLHHRIQAAERDSVDSPSWGGGCIGLRLTKLRDSGGWTLRDGGHRNDETTELRQRAERHGWETRYLSNTVAETKMPRDWRGIARRKFNYQWLRSANWQQFRSPVFWTSLAGAGVATLFSRLAWIVVGALAAVWLSYQTPRAVKTAIHTGKLRDAPLYLGYQCVSGLLRTVGAWVGVLSSPIDHDLEAIDESR